MAGKQTKTSKPRNGALKVKSAMTSDQVLKMTADEARESARATVKKHSKIIHALSKL